MFIFFPEGFCPSLFKQTIEKTKTILKRPGGGGSLNKKIKPQKVTKSGGERGTFFPFPTVPSQIKETNKTPQNLPPAAPPSTTKIKYFFFLFPKI